MRLLDADRGTPETRGKCGQALTSGLADRHSPTRLAAVLSVVDKNYAGG
jgi:hypothetical protein